VTAPLLSVRDLQVEFATDNGIVRAVDRVSFDVGAGRIVGIVGESGCGKSVTALSILGLTRGPGSRLTGQIVYRGRDLLPLRERELQHLRGKEIAMIFQDPMTSLNPVHRVGDQIVETIVVHERISRSAARRRAAELLAEVGIPNPERRADDYPHQFSGGMRQRAMIAMALACNPSILIADEPTTALDVTIQAQILTLIARLRDTVGSAVILITHDLGVVANVADDVNVMYAGRVVESASTEAIFNDPQHPYTWGLLGSIPRIDRPKEKRLRPIKGQPPSLVDLPPGCSFSPRCPFASTDCGVEPELAARAAPDHLDRCRLTLEERRIVRNSGPAPSVR
jgi:peptide/nickel transport system ATP-binding protein/oligopeptide transport system ATP-binding protein